MRRGRESEDSDEENEVSGVDADDQKSSVSDFSMKDGEDYDINEYSLVPVLPRQNTNLMQPVYGKTSSTSTQTLKEAQDSSDNENWKGLSCFDDDCFKPKGEGKKNLKDVFDDGGPDAEDCSKFINYRNLKNWKEEENYQRIHHLFITSEWEKAEGRNEVPESNTAGDDAVCGDFEDSEVDTNLMELVYGKTLSTSTRTLTKSEHSSNNEKWKSLSSFEEDYFKRKIEGKKNLGDVFDDRDPDVKDCSKFIDYENLKNWKEEENIQRIRHLFATGDWEKPKDKNEVTESNTEDFAPSATAIPKEGLDEGLTHNPSSLSCKICFEAPLEAVCTPCGHLAGCMACLLETEAKNGVCPICQAKINHVYRICVT